MLDQDDLLPEEQEAPALMKELASTYRTIPEEEQMLARVHQRLENLAKSSLPAPTRGSDSPLKMVSSLPPDRSGKTLSRRLSFAAAVLLVVFLIASLASIFTLLHGNKGTASQPLSTASVKHAVKLTGGLRLKMVTDKIGWMLGDMQRAPLSTVLRTTDGGKHWQNVTPQGVKEWDLTVLDENIAWMSKILEQNLPSGGIEVTGTEVLRTIDGGNTWQPVILPAKRSGIVSFIDQNNGWFFAPADPQISTGGLRFPPIPTPTGTPQIKNILYHTSDGGSTWQVLGTTSLVFDEIQFFDEKTGWATTVNHSSQPVLYFTTDGGRNWQVQNLPVPSGEKPDQLPYLARMLNFVNASEWYIQVGFPDHKYYIYQTRDAGATWQVLGGALPQPDVRNMLDNRHIAAFEPGARVYMLTLSNGDWQATALRLPEKGEILDGGFVSPQSGFVWIEPSAGTMDFYATVDAGKTWQKRTSLFAYVYP